jgi:gamma-glutamyl-gamma-aminobutyrate hydrolase PuuD
MKRTIYVVGGWNHYANWMEGLIVDEMWKADIVVFTGGEDVCPELYDEPRNPLTSCNRDRDLKEMDAYREAKKRGQAMVGICRGAQFLCVMAGGKLVQHQDNPHGTHYMDTFDGEKVYVTSTHHQAQYPWKMAPNTFRVLAWTKGISDVHLGGKGEEMVKGKVEDDIEVEVCQYLAIRALGIQPHPEMMMSLYGKSQTYTKSIEYFQALLNKFMREYPRASL